MNSPLSQAGPGLYRWIVFFLLAVGYLLVNFHRLCPAVVAVDLMDDLKAGGSMMGLLASAYFYPYALMQIPSGLLSDSWGPRKTITTFFILAGLSSIAFGFASTAGWAIAARVFVGVGVAMFFVPIMKILTCWFTVSEFSFMTGLFIAVGGAGALTAATPLAYLSMWIGWRGSFIFIGVVTLVSAAAIWIFVRNTPEELGWPAVRLKNPSEESSGQKIRLWTAMKEVVKSPRFWPLSLWYFCNFGLFYSFGGLWGGPYLMDVYRLSKSEAGAILSMMAIAIIIGSPIFSFVSDRVLRSRKKALVLSTFVMLLLVLAIAFFTAQFNRPMLYVWCFLWGFFGCSSSVIGFAAAKESFPISIAGTAIGLVNGFPFLGGALMQPLVGYVLDSFGKGPAGYPVEAYSQAFLWYIAVAIVSLISAFCIHETFAESGEAPSA
ncbi:MAG: MFS transporter [Candidatus Omnitrophica bacterium]|nr:MFS transporter [Candidatus Omnitrophota bacterium]